MSLTGTLRGWARRYGAEAAFVGRVAVAAFLPPGVNKLVESGLEAAFEYIQSQPERSFDADGEEGLRQRLASVGVDETKLNQLSELVSRVDGEGAVVLREASELSKAGQGYEQAELRLRQLISSDPTLSAMRASLEQVSASLTRLETQGEVLIAGQAYQTAAIEEMMQMIHAIAAQVGTSAPSPSIAQSPSAQLAAHFGLSTAPINSPQSAPQSASSALDALGSPPTTSHNAPSINTSASRDLVARFHELNKARERRAPSVSAPSASDALSALSAPQPSPSSPSQISQQEGELFEVGEGRVALSLTEVGTQPIKVVKWICEAWSFSLADAIIATQSTPVTLRRSDDFVSLARAQRELSALGATLKLLT
jgi:hypothetical protein